MSDREKVIKGLKCLSSYEVCYGSDCHYYNFDCTQKIAQDALELLKEQEPVKPIRLENRWKCPSCSGNIVANMKYCPRCGQVVKWDG